MIAFNLKETLMADKAFVAVLSLFLSGLSLIYSKLFNNTKTGDSGGPLYVFDSQSRQVLAGITSYGQALGCALSGPQK